MSTPVLVWFKNDLRLRDHTPLARAAARGAIVPVYIIDEDMLQPHRLGFPRMGAFRARFLFESLHDLRHNLRARGSNLCVRTGKPAEVLAALCRQLGAREVYTAEEIAVEEQQTLHRVEEALRAAGVRLLTSEANSLYLLEDIPWPIQRLPDIFTHFRKEVEREAQVRPALPIPTHLQSPSFDDGGPIPTPASLGLPEATPDPRSAVPYGGGETEAWRRVQDYIWEKDLLRVYKETRDGLVGSDYSSKFSAALAHGCLSPRSVYEEVMRYEQERTKNQSTYWLVFELLWRDYFRWVAKKYGSRIFQRDGLRTEHKSWHQHKYGFEKWRLGQTGVDFVDANMRELLHTGFMSNRGRQNVASYLTKDLKIDWRWGAAWFESQLLDYDVHSNWLNWAYVAGVGNDPRENRYFNIELQAKRYDPAGAYVRMWLEAE